MLYMNRIGKEKVDVSLLGLIIRVGVVLGCYFATGFGLAMTLPDPGTWHLVPAVVPLLVAASACLIPKWRKRAKDFILPTSEAYTV